MWHLSKIEVIFDNDLISNRLTSLSFWVVIASEGAKRIYKRQTFIYAHFLGPLKVLDLQKFRQIFNILTIIVNIQSAFVADRNVWRQQNTFFLESWDHLELFCTIEQYQNCNCLQYESKTDFKDFKLNSCKSDRFDLAWFGEPNTFNFISKLRALEATKHEWHFRNNFLFWWNYKIDYFRFRNILSKKLFFEKCSQIVSR